MNRFIEPIMTKKRKHDLMAWLKLKKLQRWASHTAPDYNTMLVIHDFLNTVREMYMYGYDERFHLFLGTFNSKRLVNAKAMIYKDKAFSIKFVLTNEPAETINIEISRFGNNKTETETLKFVSGEPYEIKDKFEEEKILFIESCLMDGAIEIVRYYYKNKRF